MRRLLLGTFLTAALGLTAAPTARAQLVVGLGNNGYLGVGSGYGFNGFNPYSPGYNVLRPPAYTGAAPYAQGAIVGYPYVARGNILGSRAYGARYVVPGASSYLTAPASSGYRPSAGVFRGSGYAAPRSGYAAPRSGYAAPRSGYAAPRGYGGLRGSSIGGGYGLGSSRGGR